MGQGAHHGALLLTRTADFESPDTGSLIPAGKALPWLDSRDPAVSDGDRLSLGQRHEDRLPQAAAHTPHFLNRRHRHKVETQFYLLIYKYCCVYRHHICEYYYFQTFKHNT